MKRAKIILIALCAVSLACALVGCGGSDKIAGTYDLYEIQGANGTSHDTIAELEKSGFTLFINLDEDKTFHLVMVGLDNEGTWDYVGGETIIFKPNQETLGMSDASISNGKITMTLLGDVTVFARGKDKKPSDYL